MGTDHWGIGFTETDLEVETQLIWILAMWCKRHQQTSVVFYELVELLGLEGTLAYLLEQRSTKPR